MADIVLWGVLIAPVLLYLIFLRSSRNQPEIVKLRRFELILGLGLTPVYLCLGAILIGGGNFADRIGRVLASPFHGENGWSALLFVFGTPFGWLVLFGGLAAFAPQNSNTLHQTARGAIWIGAIGTTIILAAFVAVDFS